MSYARIYNREIQSNCCLAFKTVTHQFKSFWHSHREFEIVYIESGTGCLQYGQQQKQYNKGDIFLLGPWIPHQFLETSKNHVSISLLFNHDFITPGFLDSALASEINQFLKKTRYGMLFRENMFSAEIDIIKLILAESGLEQAMHLLFLLKRLATHKNINLLLENNNRLLNSKKIAKIQDILAFINSNAHRKLLQNEVAHHFYMSTNYFSRFFHEQSGATFSQYLLTLRIERACELLQKTDIPITQISQDVGFDSLSSFNRYFAKLKNQTPRAFRISHTCK